MVQLCQFIKKGTMLVHGLLEESRLHRSADDDFPFRPEIIQLIRDIEDAMLAEDETTLTAFNRSSTSIVSVFFSDTYAALDCKCKHSVLTL